MAASNSPRPTHSKRSHTPVIFQASADRPVFFGGGGGGRDIYCSACREVRLVEDVRDEALFDLTIECARCRGRTEMGSLPAGRGLGGALITVSRDHTAVGTFVLDMDQVVVGETAVDRRKRESSPSEIGHTTLVLDVPGLELILDQARTTFGWLLSRLKPQSKGQKPSNHGLVQMMDLLEQNIVSLKAGGDVIDVFVAIDLQQSTASFSRWAQDPSMGNLMQECVQPEGFDHNASLLQVASVLEEAGLGPEFVPPTDDRSPDLVLRIAADHLIQVELKAPRALRRRESGAPAPVDPSRIVRKALRSSRGQFSGPGMLVVVGDAWQHGIDKHMEAAVVHLARPIPADATTQAKAHHKAVLGILLVQNGYRGDDRSLASESTFRWAANPKYTGPIQIQLPMDLVGSASISYIAHDADVSAEYTSHPQAVGPAGPIQDDPIPWIGIRSRVHRGQVEIEGDIVHNGPATKDELLAVYRFPPEQRPATNKMFDVACETGFTVVTVQTDGHLLADPSVGSISLRGVRFSPAPTAP